MRGGPGNDVIRGDAGDDQIIGSSGNDTMLGGSGQDIIQGGPGDDTGEGQGGGDIIDGGSDDDTLVGGDGADVLFGGPGDDLIQGGDGEDTSDGGSGTDTLDGGRQSDICISGESVFDCESGDGIPETQFIVNLEDGPFFTIAEAALRLLEEVEANPDLPNPTLVVAPGIYTENVRSPVRIRAAIPGSVTIRGVPGGPAVAAPGTAIMQGINVVPFDGNTAVSVTDAIFILADSEIGGFVEVEGASATASFTDVVFKPEIVVPFAVALNENAGQPTNTLTPPAHCGSAAVSAVKGAYASLSGVVIDGDDFNDAVLALSNFSVAGFIDWSAVGGAGNLMIVGGALLAEDLVTGPAPWYWSAPLKFLGDKTAAYADTLRFDLKTNTTGDDFPGSPLVRLTNSNAGIGIELFLSDVPASPPSFLGFTTYEVVLHRSQGWRDATTNNPATAQQIIATLSDLTELEIRGEYKTGPDTGLLDNVELNADASIGACADEEGRLYIADSTIQDIREDDSLNLGWGALVLDRGHLTLDNTHVKRVFAAGVVVDGSGSEADLLNESRVSEVTRHQAFKVAIGVVAQDDARLFLDNTQIDSVDGPGIAVLEGAAAVINSSSITDNSFAGIANVGSSALVEGSQVLSTDPDSALGGGVGIFASEPVSVGVSGSEIRDNTLANVWLHGESMGSLEIAGSTFSGAKSVPTATTVTYHGNDVFSHDTLDGLVLSNNEFNSTEGPHIFFNRASAEFIGNLYDPHTVPDVLQQGCDDSFAELDADAFTDADVIACPKYSTVFVTLKLELFLAEAQATE